MTQRVKGDDRMAGKIRLMMDTIVAEKSKENPIIASSVRTKMILKGVNIEKYTTQSEDDPKIIQVLNTIAKEFGINL